MGRQLITRGMGMDIMTGGSTGLACGWWERGAAQVIAKGGSRIEEVSYRALVGDQRGGGDMEKTPPV